ncbi:hypothetical protein [Actinospongicola halichondriae]|uniref:hypothetical protein n=1 Tax=Actinospongicola halichondriae TaxID=3236844 RepID=UPI003D485346
MMEPDGPGHVYVNDGDFWIVYADGVLTLRTAMASISEEPGTYPAEIAMILADGSRVSVRAEVQV